MAAEPPAARISNLCATIATGARILIQLVERLRDRQWPGCRDNYRRTPHSVRAVGLSGHARGPGVRLGDV